MMSQLIRFSSLAAFIFFCAVSNAADIPDDDIGAGHLSQDTCISQTTQNCIDNMCLTSDNIDCEDNCGKMAQDKCAQQVDD